jgi:hypothetical protein
MGSALGYGHLATEGGATAMQLLRKLLWIP